MTVDVKHFEDCEQLLMSIGRCYLVAALLDFFGMENVNETPEINDPFFSSNATDEKRKTHIKETLERFIDGYVMQEMVVDDVDGDPDNANGVVNYAINLLRSFMILLNHKDAVSTGNGHHLAVIHKKMIPYFFRYHIMPMRSRC